MKKQFQSKSVPRGTRTIWRYLGALFILFTFAIGNVWGADEVVVIGSQSSGNLTIATNTHSVAGISGGTNSGSTITDASDGQSVSEGSKMGGTSEIGSKLSTKSKQHIRFTVVAGETVRFYYYQTGGANKSSTFATSDFSQSAKYYHAATEYNAAAKNTLYFVDFVFADAGTYAISLTTGQSVYMAALKFTAPAAAHTVTYKAGDGSGSDVVDSDAKTVKAFADCSFTAPSGYEFKEWQDGSSNVVAAGATVSADMTLTAIYRLIPTKYTVTYSLNGAPGDAPTETSKAEGDAFNLAAAPSWAGHAFDGWLCSADAAVKTAGSSYTMTAANTTFTAQWHEVDCKIYSFTGEIGSASPQTANATVDAEKMFVKDSGDKIRLTPATGESFKVGDILTFSGNLNNSAKKFGLKLYANGGSSVSQTIENAAGTVPMICSAALTFNADYIDFARADGTGTTVYTCEVHRACAEGVAAGLAYATTEVAKTEGDAVFTNPLTNANGLVIAGYKSSNTAVATVATNGQVTVVGPGPATITANSAVQTKAGTLYAAGTASYTLTVAALPKYHVVYDLNGGSGEVAEVDHKAGEKFTLHDGVTGVTAPDSKTFVNWKDQDDALFDGGVEFTMPAKDVTLTAQWAGDVYTVKFMDGETVLDTKVVEVGSHPTDIEHPTKPLYTFAAWQLSGSDVVLDDVSGAKDAVVTLTARWAVAYASNVNFKEAATQALGVETALNTYHYASDASDISFEAKGLKIKTNAARFYFNVAPGKVAEIKFGNISGATYSVDGGAAETLSTSQLKATYSASAQSCVMTMTTDAYNIVENVVIHDPYEVNYDVDGGDPVDAQYGYPSVTLPSATRGTDSFVGWFEGDTKIGEAGDKYTPTANITLKAHWEAVSTDTRINALTYAIGAGSPVDIYEADKNTFNIAIPYAQSYDDITVAATPNHASASIKSGASLVVSSLPGAATFTIVAQSGAEENYTVNFSMAPKDGVSIIKATVNSSTKNSIGEVTGLYKKDASCGGLSGYKFNGKGAYIGLELVSGQTFNEGDIINIHTTTAAEQGTIALFDDHGNTVSSFHDYGVMGGLGDNKFALPASAEEKSLIYVCRTEANTWNGYVDYIEVTRPMDPVLTAITINGEAGTINESAKTVAVELQPGYDLDALTIVPTIVSNTAEADVVKTVTSNSGNWVIGDNTYRLTDKDGDYTEYTVTLTAGALKHTVTFNTHGGSAIASVQVVDGQKLAAAPAEPEKEDYLFQGWSETDGGAIIDITKVIIDKDTTFHAVWAAETGVVKLLDGDGNVNVTDFITAVAKGTVNFDDVDHNCATFSSTASTIVGATGANKFIIYNAKTNQTKIKFVLYNSNSSAQKIVLQKLAEGEAATTDVEIDVPSKERFETPYYTYNSDANRTMYVFTKNTNVKVLQVKVVDDGTPVKQAGEIGYSLNLNKGRVFAPSGSAVDFEGLTLNASSNYKVLNSEMLQSTANISFSVASPLTLVLESTGAKYQVSTDAAGSGEEFVAGTNEHNLTAGTWYIVSPTGSNLKFTNIAFSAPKCEKPAFSALANSDLCEGDAFVALDGTGTVSDGGTITYKWYAEGGTDVLGTDATYTPAADGNYFVVALHHVDGFTDNEATSDVVSVTHFASAAITTAPKDQRVDADQNATLTVVASGKAPLSYQWYKCDDETGANPVIIDGAESDSYEVAVTSGFSQYFKVVVSSGCGEASAVAKVEEWVELSQVSVSESTVWDWATIGNAINATVAPEKNVEKLMANIRDGEKTIVNDASFNSQALLFYGQEALIKDGSRWFAKGGYISFNTTVPGVVTVEFSDNGSNNRRLSINGKLSEPSTAKGDVKSFMAIVPAGEVKLMGVNNDGSGSNQYIRISKIEFMKVDYTRDVTVGRLGTICLPNGGKMYGADLYEVAYFDASAKKIFFDEILSGEMEAGVPYVFLPNGKLDKLAVAYTDEVEVPAGNKNGLYGSYTQEALATDGTNYILINNQYCRVVEANTYVGANRAYLKIGVAGGVPTNAVAPAPGRRRISMGVQSEQVATGIGDVQGDEVQSSKVLINGQLFIFRGEKMYDATGRLVK